MDHPPAYVIATLGVLALQHRLSGPFVERKGLNADDTEVTPPQILADGRGEKVKNVAPGQNGTRHA